MTEAQWRGEILRAQVDTDAMYKLSRLLGQQDRAKSELSLVFGWTGIEWPDLVTEIKNAAKGPQDRLSIEP